MLLLTFFCTASVLASAKPSIASLGCESALRSTRVQRIEVAVGVAEALISDPARFVNEFDTLEADAVPSPGAEHPETKQAMYVQNKMLADLVHVEFRHVEGSIVITRLSRMSPSEETAFYGTYAFHHDFTFMSFRVGGGEDALKLGERTFRDVTLSPSVRAKIWLKHRLDLDQIRAVVAKVRFARPGALPLVSAAAMTLRGVPYQMYFYQTGRSLSLRTLYQSGPRLKRTKKPRPQPAAESNAA